jgi:hypothetical protein
MKTAASEGDAARHRDLVNFPEPAVVRPVAVRPLVAKARLLLPAKALLRNVDHVARSPCRSI